MYAQEGWNTMIITLENTLISNFFAERKIRSYMGRSPQALSKTEALEMAGAFAAVAASCSQGLMPPRDIQEAMKTYIIAVLHE